MRPQSSGKQFLAWSFSIVLFLFFSTLPIFAQGIEDEMELAAAKLVSSAESAGSKTIAVANFSNLDGQASLLGKYFAEELTVSLIEKSTTSKMSVVDRANLQRLMDEMKLTSDGLVNPDNSKKLGKLAGVDALIVGTILELGDSFRWTAKVIETESARIIGAHRATIAATPEMKTLWAAASNLSNPSALSMPSGGANPSPSAIKYEAIEASGVEMLINRIAQSASDITIHAEIRNTTTAPLRVYAGNTNSSRFFDFREDLSKYQMLGGHLIGDNGDRFRLLNISGMTLIDAKDDPAALYKDRNNYLSLSGSEKKAIVIEFGARGTDQYSGRDQVRKVSGILEARIVTSGGSKRVFTNSFNFKNLTLSD